MIDWGLLGYNTCRGMGFAGIYVDTTIAERTVPGAGMCVVAFFIHGLVFLRPIVFCLVILLLGSRRSYRMVSQQRQQWWITMLRRWRWRVATAADLGFLIALEEQVQAYRRHNIISAT